jgi:hypothetical protein
MVDSGTPERRDEPAYSLDGIRRLAGFSQVEYRGKKVLRDVAGLGYRFEDVCHCLLALQAEDFSHSERYENFPCWHDVYKIRHTGRDGKIHRLYIKLRTSVDCVTIELCSFHP